jgi:L-alanine-DL-glutamate epimerase-like enolase superfamily enzyme
LAFNLFILTCILEANVDYLLVLLICRLRAFVIVGGTTYAALSAIGLAIYTLKGIRLGKSIPDLTYARFRFLVSGSKIDRYREIG